MRQPLPSQEVVDQLPPDGGEEFNRLIHERSPYLLQHARNPVDWHPWGDEAFRRARETDRPIFLSIGYSTCHWCHVMERESFENEAIAALMNEHFVCIKVDREERPDVDSLYMAAVQRMGVRGGWPLSLFLTPAAEPFWGGTYFPPEDHFQRPGFRTVLQSISRAWSEERDRILEVGREVTRALQSVAEEGAVEALDPSSLERGFAQLQGMFDSTHGGFGGAPKFPTPHNLTFLLRQHARTGRSAALVMVEVTLEHMARGGIRDHLGGGFHRYSTDRTWLVPHFEKMLYDQALLGQAYLEAYQVSGREAHAQVARAILDYVLRDLQDAAGGFHSAEDADSEGEEGKFYVWSRAEILELLGEERGELLCRVYGVTGEGNYREEASGHLTGASILHLPHSLAEVAEALERDLPDLEAELAGMRQVLLGARSERVRPHLDDKVLTDWNALMISTLSLGGRVLEEPRYTEAARRAATFLLERMVQEGRLLHCYRAGEAAIPAYLDDHAFLVQALLDLYEATFEIRWLREARRLARELVQLFGAEDGSGFRFRGRDSEPLIAEIRELHDGAVPSGNSVATVALLRLGRLLADTDLEEAGRRNLQAHAAFVQRAPAACTHMLQALDLALGPGQELVLTRGAGLETMRQVLDHAFLPRTVVAFRGDDDAILELVPYLEHHVPVDGRATAYLCEGYACQQPTTDPDTLRTHLHSGTVLE